MQPNLQLLLEKVTEISVEVGRWIANQSVDQTEIESKSFNNLVSFVDKSAEERFITAFKKLLPEAGFIAEEGGGKPGDGALNWIIDPLDGTTNFLHGVPIWCTSIALHHRDDGLLLGAIYDPNRDELFTAIKNGGAQLNNQKIRVSSCDKLEECLLGTGFPYDDYGRSEAYFTLLNEITRTTRGVRRPGSAAIDLAYVACGRYDAFYEYALNPWDVAAGILITQEAGGRCSGFSDSTSPLFGPDILASNAHVHQYLQATIQRHFLL